MKRIKPYLKLTNLWIALFLLAANGVAWFTIANRIDLLAVEPILHPEIADIRAHWQAGDAVGEPFSVVVTDRTAMETLTWFMEPRPNLPFSHPQVEIHHDYVLVGGVAHVMGLRVPVFGRTRIYLENGKLEADIQEVGVAGTEAPAFVIDAIAQAQAVYADMDLPIEVTRLVLREGEVLVEGVYR